MRARLSTLPCLLALAACSSPLGTTAGAPASRPGDDPGPVLHHEYSGNLQDSSGFGHDGERVGFPSYGAGCLGGAVVFDGVGTAVEVASTPALEPREFSVELVFRPATTLQDGFGFTPLLVKLARDRNFWNSADGYDLWYQDSGAGGRLGFGVGSAGGSLRVQVSEYLTIEAGECHHVVGTYDGQALKLYLDGKLVGTEPFQGPVAYLGGPVRIGGGIRHSYYPSTGAHWFEGSVDEAVIHPRALRASEVRDRYLRIGRPTGREPFAFESP